MTVFSWSLLRGVVFKTKSFHMEINEEFLHPRVVRGFSVAQGFRWRHPRVFGGVTRVVMASTKGFQRSHSRVFGRES